MKLLVKLSYFQVQEKMLRNLSKERMLALRLILFGNLFSILWLVLSVLIIAPPILTSPWDTLDYTLTWDMFPILFVVFSLLQLVFKQISTNEQSIDAKPTKPLYVYEFCIHTFMIQIGLFIPVHIAVAFTVPDTWLSLIPSSSILFMFGGWVYQLGFSLRPLLRFFGFACMLTPTFLGCLYTITMSFFIF